MSYLQTADHINDMDWLNKYKYIVNEDTRKAQKLLDTIGLPYTNALFIGTKLYNILMDPSGLAKVLSLESELVNKPVLWTQSCIYKAEWIEDVANYNTLLAQADVAYEIMRRIGLTDLGKWDAMNIYNFLIDKDNFKRLKTVMKNKVLW